MNVTLQPFHVPTRWGGRRSQSSATTAMNNHPGHSHEARPSGTPIVRTPRPISGKPRASIWGGFALDPCRENAVSLAVCAAAYLIR